MITTAPTKMRGGLDDPGVRPLVAGNWKMNGLSRRLAEIDAMRRAADAGEAGAAEMLVCPPATLIAQAAWRIKGGDSRSAARTAIRSRAAPSPATFPRRCSRTPARRYVIVGHSERRTCHGETDALVRAKAEAALKAGLTAIVCVGETQAEREAGEAGRGGHAAIARLAAAEAAAGDAGRRLRAGLGDRHRAYARRPRTSPRCMTRSGRCSARSMGRPARKMRILYGGSVKPGKCQRAFDPRQRRRRAGRRRQPQGGGIFGDRGRLSLE